MEKFTIEEIKTYIKSKDSLGDVMYYLTAENIRKANEPKEEEEPDINTFMKEFSEIKNRK